MMSRRQFWRITGLLALAGSESKAPISLAPGHVPLAMTRLTGDPIKIWTAITCDLRTRTAWLERKPS
jgi:hypothetical protein